MDKTKIPTHVAIIMDGNGRWAQARGLERVAGHQAGALVVRKIVEESRRLGIKFLTLYAFSTENWARPESEVSALMQLFVQYLRSELKLLLDNDIRFRAIGDLQRLAPTVRSELEQVIEATKHCSSMQLIIAISYGGREELVTAAKRIAQRVVDGELKIPDISAEDLSAALYAPDIPDPDLLIRTSDQLRISNFLLWQLAYSEIIVTPVFWPDFSVEELHKSLKIYAKRIRRFGMTTEQVLSSEAAENE